MSISNPVAINSLAQFAALSTIDLAVPAGGIPLNAYAFANFGCDNTLAYNGSGNAGQQTDFHLWCHDSKGNVWRKRHEVPTPNLAGAGGGGFLSWWECHIRKALVSGDVIQCKFAGSPVARVCGGDYVTVDSGKSLQMIGGRYQSSTTTALNLDTWGIVGEEKLSRFCILTEGILGDTFTIDATYAQTFTRVATADATAANNLCICGGYDIHTTNGTDVAAHTITSRDVIYMLNNYMEINDPLQDIITGGGSLLGSLVRRGR